MIIAMEKMTLRNGISGITVSQGLMIHYDHPMKNLYSVMTLSAVQFGHLKRSKKRQSCGRAWGGDERVGQTEKVELIYTHDYVKRIASGRLLHITRRAQCSVITQRRDESDAQGGGT